MRTDRRRGVNACRRVLLGAVICVSSCATSSDDTAPSGTTSTDSTVVSPDVVATSTSIASAPPPTDPVVPDLDRGLIAHYALDGDAVDELGDNNGVATELEAATDRNGVEGGAVRFGVGSVVEVANPAELNVTRDFSIAAWVDIGELGDDWHTLFEKSDPERGGHSRYGLWLHGRRPAVCFEAFDNSRQPCLEADVDVPVDGWHHVAAVRDANEFRLFLDGSQIARGFAGFLEVSQTPFSAFIGTDRYEPDAVWLDALVDEVRVYNRPLLDVEVSELAAS